MPILLAVAGCGGDDDSEPTNTVPGLAGITCKSPDDTKGPGAGTKAIGVVYAGSKTDLGYNQAVHTAAAAVRDACPDLELLESDIVREASGMTQAAERMIDEGAKVIFSTSPTYADAAVALARKHSDVVVLQQGAVVDDPLPPNLGTYDGSAYEPSYLAGIVAATVTKSKKLGFVTGSARPRSLANVNAFALGALSVDPKMRTYVRFTGSACAPAAQRRAALSLLSEKADVLAQEQDCTSTVIKAAETAGKYSVGFHFNARALAPMGWLTGVESDWAPLFGAIVSSIQKGTFAKSEFHDNVVVGFSSTKIPRACGWPTTARRSTSTSRRRSATRARGSSAGGRRSAVRSSTAAARSGSPAGSRRRAGSSRRCPTSSGGSSGRCRSSARPHSPPRAWGSSDSGTRWRGAWAPRVRDVL